MTVGHRRDLWRLRTGVLYVAQGQPHIFNTDQGVQITSAASNRRLEQAGIQISWDGLGRTLDNLFVERL